MNKPRQQLLALALLMSAAIMTPTLAAESWYEVELIVFQQPDPVGSDAELHPVEPPPPKASQTVSLRSPQSGKVPYTQLDTAQLKLGSLYQGLQRSPTYKPLLHLGWRQPGLSNAEAPAIALPAEWQPWTNAELPPLHGLVRLRHDRFIHFEVDLRYRPAAAEAGTSLAPTYINKQSRRLRSDELHYLDHAALGVIVQVRSLAE